MNDDDYIATMASDDNAMTTDEQKKAGQAIAGDMDEDHKNFLQFLIKLIDDGDIDVSNPESFLNQEIYAHLDEAWRDKVDLALMNIAHQVELINEFYRSTETPDESPQLQTMVEQLWEMKQRIEVDQEHDVFQF